MEYVTTFERNEKKYKLNRDQYRGLMQDISPHIDPDEFHLVLVQNLYFDTPYYDLISTSLQKPTYKEKLRIRRYGPYRSADDEVFAEIKKKYKGVVYKRRFSTTLKRAMQLMEGAAEECETQLEKEIASTASHYRGLSPKMLLTYKRESWVSKEDHNLRITFDCDIRWDSRNVALGEGDRGNLLLPKDTLLLEIKCMGGYPLWLCDSLSHHCIYPGSFSKYGNAFMQDAAKRYEMRLEK